MKMRLHFVVAVLFMAFASSCIKETTDEQPIPSVESIRAMESEVLAIVNAYRSSKGFNTLQYSEVAYQYASTHNDYMISKGDLSHDNFSSRASNISAETNAEEVAENLARGFGTAVEAFDAWINSSKHKETMEGNFTHTAVSVKKDGFNNYYYVQLFYR